MNVSASNAFLRFKKKSTKAIQLEIDHQVRAILENPEIGELKKGDLRGIRVHKFKVKSQLYLISYEVTGETLNLYVVGTHENFYDRLKNLLY